MILVSRLHRFLVITRSRLRTPSNVFVLLEISLGPSRFANLQWLIQMRKQFWWTQQQHLRASEPSVLAPCRPLAITTCTLSYKYQRNASMTSCLILFRATLRARHNCARTLTVHAFKKTQNRSRSVWVDVVNSGTMTLPSYSNTSDNGDHHWIWSEVRERLLWRGQLLYIRVRLVLPLYNTSSLYRLKSIKWLHFCLQ